MTLHYLDEPHKMDVDCRCCWSRNVPVVWNSPEASWPEFAICRECADSIMAKFKEAEEQRQSGPLSPLPPAE